MQTTVLNAQRGLGRGVVHEYELEWLFKQRPGRALAAPVTPTVHASSSAPDVQPTVSPPKIVATDATPAPIVPAQNLPVPDFTLSTVNVSAVTLPAVTVPAVTVPPLVVPALQLPGASDLPKLP